MSWTVPLNFSQPMWISSQLPHFSWSRTWPQLMVSSSNPSLLRIGPFFFSETGPLRIHVGHFRWGWNQLILWSSNLYHLSTLCICWSRVVTKIRFRPNLHYFAICVFQKSTYKFHPATFPIVQILLCKCFINKFYLQLYCIFTLITSVCCLFLQYFDD